MSERRGVDLIVDRRWDGRGGIGRFALEVNTRLPVWRSIRTAGRPSSPVATIATTAAVARARRTSIAVGRQPLFFTPGFLPPVNFLDESVIVMHDVMYSAGGAASSAIRTQYFDRILRRQARGLAGIVTGTETSRRRLREWLRSADVPIVTAGYGVDVMFFGRPRPRSERRQEVLYVGRRQTTKNITRLLGAFAMSDARRAGIDLAMTGSVDRELARQLERFELDGRVRMLGRLSDAELAEHYAASIALLLPSLDEGIGLPAAESMASGTPVVYGGGSLPEVVAAGGVAVDPTSIESISAGIDAAVFDEARWSEIERDRGDESVWPHLGRRRPSSRRLPRRAWRCARARLAPRMSGSASGIVTLEAPGATSHDVQRSRHHALLLGGATARRAPSNRPAAIGYTS